MSTAKSKLHVFRAGKHVSASGEVAEFSAERVAALATAYDPKVYKAPFVIGHPKTEDVAWGWVGALNADAGNLFAEDDDELPTLPEFKEMVNAGRFRNISVAIWPKGHPSSPKPEGDYLKHIGFLGATAPAVKGLTPAHFKDNDDKILTVEFGEESEIEILEKLKSILFPNSKTKRLQPAHFNEEITTMSETAEQLAAREAKLAQGEKDFAAKQLAFAETQKAAVVAAARTDAVAFAEKMAKEGKILPIAKAGIVETLVSMAGGAELEFSEDDGKGGTVKVKKTPADIFKASIEGSKPVITFHERTPAGATPTAGNVVEFRAPDGMTVDKERAALHCRVLNYAEKNKLPYDKALAAVERNADVA